MLVLSISEYDIEIKQYETMFVVITVYHYKKIS